MRKAYISIAALLLCGSMLMAQTPANRTAKTTAADVLAQMPAAKQAAYNKLIGDLSSTGEEGVLMLVNMINAPGKGSNANVDYALSGLTHYVMAKGEENARLVTAKAYLKALEMVNERETKAFIIRQLQMLGKDECIDVLASYLNDESLSGGVIDYAYKGNDPKLTLSKSEMNELRTTVSKVLNTLGSCPEEYRTQADLYVEEDETAVVLTALRGWTCWNSSLGYYYYRYDQAPASLKDVKVYAVFPNTQMTWNNGSLQASPQGIKEGTAVQLKYFDDPEYPKGKNFPKGYYIGFILACNAWNTYFTGFNSYTLTEGFYASSTKGFSTKVNSGIDVRTAMFKDKNSNIAIAFEDFMDDQNFTDVVFSLKANPEITNVPPVDEDLNTTIEKTGVYAFEDEWPKAGDYDMNDVLVQYTYQKVFNIFNEILSESFIFKTLYNKSTVFTNGLGFILSNEGNAQSTEYFIRKENEKDFTVASGADKFTRESNAIILTDNVKTNPNAEYKVTFKYGDKNSNKKQETSIDAFIYRPSKEGNRLEVHCPMKKPTSKVDTSLFGQYEDCSKPNEGIYYVSNQENIYPFAFYLSNANANDIAELKNFDKNEKKSISEIYPKFIDWAKYGTNADWYKKK